MDRGSPWKLSTRWHQQTLSLTLTRNFDALILALFEETKKDTAAVTKNGSRVKGVISEEHLG